MVVAKVMTLGLIDSWLGNSWNKIWSHLWILQKVVMILGLVAPGSPETGFHCFGPQFLLFQLPIFFE